MIILSFLPSGSRVVEIDYLSRKEAKKILDIWGVSHSAIY